MISYFTSVENCICQIDDAEPGCWVNVIDPDPDEIDILRNRFGVSEDYIRSALDSEESARIEAEDGDVFLIYDVPYAEREENEIVYNTMPVGVVVKPQYIITIALKDNPVIMDFSQGVVKNIKTSFKTTFVLSMLFRMSTRFLQYLKQIDKHSYNLEVRLRQSMQNKELIQLLSLQKSLVYFKTSLKSNNAMVERMLRGKYIKLYEEDEDFIR